MHAEHLVSSVYMQYSRSFYRLIRVTSVELVPLHTKSCFSCKNQWFFFSFFGVVLYYWVSVCTSLQQALLSHQLCYNHHIFYFLHCSPYSNRMQIQHGHYLHLCTRERDLWLDMLEACTTCLHKICTSVVTLPCNFRRHNPPEAMHLHCFIQNHPPVQTLSQQWYMLKKVPHLHTSWHIKH